MSTEDKQICQFCNTEFKNLRSMENHQRATKYCLAIQGKLSDAYKCIGCNKSFATNYWLTSHHKSCLEYQLVTFSTIF